MIKTKLNPSDFQGLSFHDESDLMGDYFTACMYKTKKVDFSEQYKDFFIPEVYANRYGFGQVSFLFDANDGDYCRGSIGLYYELDDFAVIDEPEFVAITDENDGLVWQGKWSELSKEWKLFIDSLDGDIVLEEYILEKA